MKRLICFLLTAVLLMGTFCIAGAETTGGTTMTGLELVQDMKIGWNLGNTLDAPSETAWGNPPVTKELLLKVKELGFNTIRIPISWSRHTSGAPDYIIDADYMDRVAVIVNDALDAGLYVIINSHHDNEIYMPKADNEERGKAYLTAIWTQIGERFRDADYHLIFQTMNEPRITGTSYEWAINTGNADCMAAVEVINQLNQAALDAMRATGGNNADRFVVISAYAGSPDSSTNRAFRLPQDSVEDRLIVSVHAYTPYNLALSLKSTVKDFKKTHASEIKSMLRKVNYTFVSKGIPVIIDEMGCLNKDNPEARYEWAKTYVSLAKQFGMTCIWWDNGSISGSGENFGLINRRTLELYEQSVRAYEGLMDGLTAENAE